MAKKRSKKSSSKSSESTKKAKNKDSKSKSKKKKSSNMSERFSMNFIQKKMNLTSRYLILFFVLALVSLITYLNVTQELYVFTFGILSIILSFVFIAFLISFLVFVFLKMAKNRA